MFGSDKQDDVTSFMAKRMERIQERAKAKPQPRQTSEFNSETPQNSTALVPVDMTKNYSGDITRIMQIKDMVYDDVYAQLDVNKAAGLSKKDLSVTLQEILSEIMVEKKLSLNQTERTYLIALIADDLVGLGPLEPLLEDDSVTDIMVNGPDRVYVEIDGKLKLTDIRFRDDDHVLGIARRIVTKIGRRIDESTPLVDARLEDGSRVNVIIPPLALNGPSISIRKFSRQLITLDQMARQDNMSRQMSELLKIAARCRLNILISGGTGSGKTTLLNALSQMIDVNERIITIEDAAELQLQQPHVVSLETRPANLEGTGKIEIKDLLVNALRMRPDRIIVGEVRSGEVVDMLQAMNTGHDGSLGTIHANNPREAFTRMENMFSMAGLNITPKGVRTQISQALDLVIQVERMRDGKRRITRITEVTGMEGDIITTQDLFTFEFADQGLNGEVHGTWKYSGLRPSFSDKARYYGLDQALFRALAD